jgi:hypothetical protein
VVAPQHLSADLQVLQIELLGATSRARVKLSLSRYICPMETSTQLA